MKSTQLARPSLALLLTTIEHESFFSNLLFRGHSDAKWKLLPSLYRLKEPNIRGDSLSDSYDLYESACLNKFFNEATPYLPVQNRSYSNDRVLAQHFGVPTRLLDWSRDPFVALFFAVSNWSENCDAALFYVMPDARFRPEDVHSLENHRVIELTPPAIDQRIPSQKSAFTFHPYGDPNAPFRPLEDRDGIGNRVINQEGKTQRGFGKIVIPRDFKRRLFQDLLRIGVDRRNLFPGLDGVGADVAERAKTGQLH